MSENMLSTYVVQTVRGSSSHNKNEKPFFDMESALDYATHQAIWHYRQEIRDLALTHDSLKNLCDNLDRLVVEFDHDRRVELLQAFNAITQTLPHITYIETSYPIISIHLSTTPNATIINSWLQAEIEAFKAIYEK